MKISAIDGDGEAGVLPQEWSADPAPIQDQQNRRVQIAIGLYRKMTVEEREQVKQAQAKRWRSLSS